MLTTVNNNYRKKKENSAPKAKEKLRKNEKRFKEKQLFY
jgi:hypothetical protein